MAELIQGVWEGGSRNVPFLEVEAVEAGSGWGKRKTAAGAEVLFLRRWEGQVLKERGVRCTRIQGVAYQECYYKSVSPRVSL